MTWLTNWNRRKLITVNGTTAGAQSDYQMKLTVNQTGGTYSAGIVNLGGNILTTFNDLRFTKSYDNTLLSYWIESITGTTPNQVATVWIKLAPSLDLDTIPASPGTYSFYIYYNNPTAISASSGTNTFDYFENFESATVGAYIDTLPNWTKGNTTVTIQNDYPYSGTKALRAVGYQNVVDYGIYTFPTPITSNVIIECAIRSNKPTTLDYAWTRMETLSSTNIVTQIMYGRPQDGTGAKILLNSTSSILVNPYSPNTYYYIRQDLKLDTDKVDGWINGSKILTDVSFITAVSNITAMKFWAYDAYSNNQSNLWIDDIKIRKYAATEPTFSTTGSEELGITAYSMSLHPSETPCRTGICTVRADVTWQNLGSSSVTFRPKILIDGATYVQAASDTTIVGAYPATSSLIQITTPTLSAGTHSICPYPN